MADLERARPLLEWFAAAINPTSARWAAAGQQAKAVNQVLVARQLRRRRRRRWPWPAGWGLPMAAVCQALASGAGRVLGPGRTGLAGMWRGSFPLGFKSWALHRKDLAIALAAA